MAYIKDWVCFAEAFSKACEEVIERCNAFNKAVENMGEITMEDTEMDNGWEDLDISNIPRDFFVNERYEIRNRWKENEWYSSDYSEIGKRGQIIIEMQKEKYYDYQYRLEPLESIKITKEEWNYLLKRSDIKYKKINNNEYINATSGRKVEIID